MEMEVEVGVSLLYAQVVVVTLWYHAGLLPSP